MSRLRSVAGAAVVLALVVANYRVARADSHIEDSSVAEVSGQLTLPAGRVFILVPFEFNLTKDAEFEPVSVAPDVWYGVVDALTVGLVHSAGGLNGLFGGVGKGVCFTGEEQGCAEVYDNAGLALRLNLLSGSFGLAVEVGGFVNKFDPLTVVAKAGFIANLQAGPLNVVLNPNMLIGVTERDADAMAGTPDNKEVINAPIAFVLGLGSKFSVGVQSGITGPLEDFADLYVVPLSAGLRLVATNNISFDLTFSFPGFYSALLEETSTDNRTMTLAAALAL
ncbi:MAG: hypothetical protein MJE77_08600 [Proteobacteria bacterium]|nr:hypothetical protein [Pseudomonadota bacterium]